MNNNTKRKFITVLVAGCFGAVQAAPTLPTVVSGQATFGQQGNVFTITNTPNAIINWQSFSVNPGEVTRFVQQNADSAVLNRITGQDPSQILGALQSNGHVFLLNPNGVMFGRAARIDVNGLTASTLGLSDADFLAGRRNFSAGAVAGKLSNQGSITTPHGGKVFLIAASVENSGIINAPNGEVVLAAGHSVQLVDSANPALRVVVSAPAGETVNLGQVVSQGGKIGIYGALVRQRGVVNANSAVRGADGKIILKGSGDTMLEAGSRTSATGAGTGGTVSVLGQRVALTGDARIDASGKDGGGTVLVGGDLQGKNPAVQNARQAWVGKDASIRADATGSGNGGKVIVWSDDATRAFGTISARGGSAGGNGGMVETSGHYLDVNGARVDAGAAKGVSGTWLLDPLNIEITGIGTDVLSDGDAFSKNAGLTTRIAPSLINNATTTVILQATNNIDFNSAVSIASGAGSLRAEAGNAISVNASISASGGDLDFRAGNRFTLAGGASLDTPGYVDIKTDNIVLNGTIGNLATRPNVSFTPFSADRPMRISSTKAAGELSLSPTELNQVTGYGINIGSSATSGDITVSANYTAAAGKTPNLVLETGGSIRVQGSIDLSTHHPDSHAVLGRYGVSSGGIEVIETSAIKSASIVARSDKLVLGGELDAGAAGVITIMPQQAATMISLGGGASDETGTLGLSNTELGKLRSGSLTIGGNDGQSGRLAVVGAANLEGAGKVVLNAGEGKLDINGALKTSSRLTLVSFDEVGQSGDGIITAPALEARASRVNLGQANAVSAIAGSASGGNFDFGSAGNLVLGRVLQSGAGSITIKSAGTMTIPEIDPFEPDARARVRSGAGAIRLSSTGAMTIDGNVESESGSIALDADGDAVLTVGSTGIVRSTAGDVSLKARRIANTGSVRAPGGKVRTDETDVPPVQPPVPPVQPPVTPPVVTPPVVTPPVITPPVAPPVTPPEPPVVTPPVLVPPVDPRPQGPTFDQCVAAPGTAGCSSVLPSLSQCTAAPSTPGCAVVLPTLAQCAGSPALQGCSAILPTASSCVADPAAPGCAVVRPAPTREPGDNKLSTALQQQVGLGQKSAAAEEKKVEAKDKDDQLRVVDKELPSGAKDESPSKKTYCN